MKPNDRTAFTLTLTSSLGLIFNSFILLVLIWQRRFRKASHLLLVHLAICDSALCLLILATNVTVNFLSSRGEDPSTLLLHHLGFLWTLLPPLIFWTICGLSLERYAAVTRPFNSSKLVNGRTAVYFLLISGVLCGTLSLAPLAGICSYHLNPWISSFHLRCIETSQLELIFSPIFLTSVYFIPSFIVISTQVHLLSIARGHRNKILGSFPAEGTKVWSTKSSPVLAMPNVSSRTGDILLLVVIISVGLLWTPTYACFLSETATRSDVPPILVSLAAVLLSLIPMVNAYVYGIRSRVLRQMFKMLIQRLLFQAEASIEIDRRLSLRSQSSIRFSLAWYSILTPSMSSQLSNQRSQFRRYSAPNILLSSFPKTNDGIEPTGSTSRRLSVQEAEESTETSINGSQFVYPPVLSYYSLSRHKQETDRRASILSNPFFIRSFLTPIEEAKDQQSSVTS